MVAAWPEPVQRVSSYLRDAGAEARIEEFASGTPTAEAAAEAVGCELDQIVKSLVLMCDGRPVSPFPLPAVADVLLERTLLRHDIVWVGAGSPKHMAGLSPGELTRLARAKPADVVTDYHSTTDKES